MLLDALESVPSKEAGFIYSGWTKSWDVHLTVWQVRQRHFGTLPKECKT